MKGFVTSGSASQMHASKLIIEFITSSRKMISTKKEEARTSRTNTTKKYQLDKKDYYVN